MVFIATPPAAADTKRIPVTEARQQMASIFERIQEIEPSLNGAGLKIGVVMSRFNLSICEGLLSGCLHGLTDAGVAQDDITLATVPGALELPVTLATMARSGGFDALVALGAVIRGETYHFEVVSNESAAGITRVQVETGVPVANGVLTVDREAQAEERMSQKGREAGECAVEMARLRQALGAPVARP